ncbi:hypothetical protein HWV00_05580 [Moritella sp. 24]|uniref:PKD domain-containing protein n=1 Tax=Moritella sp. 24 TaxID=2746230 RepID=UPI001BA4EE5C|nr:right-handed parallel beta-helix repeat-containing protein [Moritella sp. 24]QUM75742.1 hypothetical protein HWV00_05580 [Moritella sp. 24]
MNIKIILMFVISICLGVSFSISAKTYFVAPYGSDVNSGTADSPFYSVNYAIKKLKPGDTLYLYGGIYYESVEVEVSGTEAAPILISSVVGETAVIDSGHQEFREPGNKDWELVNAELGEYRSLRKCKSKDIYGYVLGIPGYVNERVKLVPYEEEDHFRATTDKYDGSRSEFYVGPGTMEIMDRCHIRLSKTEAMRKAEALYVQVFETENADPSNYQIILSQESNTLEVKGNYLTFKNLTINQAKDSIDIDDGAHHVTFDGITAWMGNTTISTTDTDVHHITITNSQILGDDPYWIFWSDMKDDPVPATRARGTSINLKGGSKYWFISWNLIRGSGQDLIGTSNGEDRIFIHHNRIENCGDDAFEIEGVKKYGGTADIGQIVIHDNLIINCLVAVAIGQDTEKMTGPLLFYRNVVILLRDHPVNRKSGINSWNGGGQFGYGKMFKQAGSDYATRNAHYYHNTLVMLNSDDGIVPIPRFPDGSTFANNIVVMVNGEIIESYNLGKDQLIDANLYWKVNTQDNEPLLDGEDTVGDLSLTGVEENSIGNTPKRGSDPNFTNFTLNIVDNSEDYWELKPISEVFGFGDFILRDASPAKGKSKMVTCRNISGTDENGVSICNDGVLVGSKMGEDIGAIPYTASPSDYAMFPFVVTAPISMVSAGVDQSIMMPDSAILMGSVSDDALTMTWTQISGEGDATFTDTSEPQTKVSFSAEGGYTLRLTASDGEIQSFDDVVITVTQEGSQVLSRRIEASKDDAEERSDGRVKRTSSDLELVYEKTVQIVGMRFNRIDIPQGATIVNAYIQFQAEEKDSVETALTIQGELSDNAGTFQSEDGDISSRPRTTASVNWNPDAWGTVGEADNKQKTSDISILITEVTDQTGWVSGNSLVIIITGTGKRVAEAYDADQNGAPLLYIEYSYIPRVTSQR